jgi:hypothetical protein
MHDTQYCAHSLSGPSHPYHVDTSNAVLTMRAAHGPSRSIPAAAVAAVLAYAYSIAARPRDSVELGAAYVMSSRHIPSRPDPSRARPAPWPRPPGCRRRVSALCKMADVVALQFKPAHLFRLVIDLSYRPPVPSRLVGILKFVLVTTPPPPPLARSSLKLRLQPKSSSYTVKLQLRGTSQGTITPELIIRLAVPLGSGVGHCHILNWKLNSNFKLESKQAGCPSCASLPRATGVASVLAPLILVTAPGLGLHFTLARTRTRK